MSFITRVIRKLSTYSFADACRKITYFLLGYCKEFIHLFRKLRFNFYTKCWAENISGPVFISTIANKMQLGKRASIYPHAIFELSENAPLSIGNNFTLSYGAVIACHHSITIGDFVMIGEYSSVRDTTHNYNQPGIPYCRQGDSSAEIVIGNNVWIGRGCIILPGSIIEDGVIVGAHSVVKGRLNADSMYAGSPLKIIRTLGPQRENTPVVYE